MNDLKADYEEKLKLALNDFKNCPLELPLQEERLRTEISCYRVFIAELIRLINDTH